jgi:hypothetical protein
VQWMKNSAGTYFCREEFRLVPRRHGGGVHNIDFGTPLVSTSTRKG